MADPMYQGPKPVATGRVNVDHACVGSACEAVQLSYELRGPPDGERVLLVCGAMTTLRHMDQLADTLAAGGLQAGRRHRGRA